MFSSHIVFDVATGRSSRRLWVRTGMETPLPRTRGKPWVYVRGMGGDGGGRTSGESTAFIPAQTRPTPIAESGKKLCATKENGLGCLSASTQMSAPSTHIAKQPACRHQAQLHLTLLPTRTAVSTRILAQRIIVYDPTVSTAHPSHCLQSSILACNHSLEQNQIAYSHQFRAKVVAPANGTNIRHTWNQQRRIGKVRKLVLKRTPPLFHPFAPHNQRGRTNCIQKAFAL